MSSRRATSIVCIADWLDIPHSGIAQIDSLEWLAAVRQGTQPLTQGRTITERQVIRTALIHLSICDHANPSTHLLWASTNLAVGPECLRPMLSVLFLCPHSKRQAPSPCSQALRLSCNNPNRQAKALLPYDLIEATRLQGKQSGTCPKVSIRIFAYTLAQVMEYGHIKERVWLHMRGNGVWSHVRERCWHGALSMRHH